MTRRRVKLTEVVKIIREAKCPMCGTEDAYIGLNTVECPNPQCSKYEPALSGAGSMQQGPKYPGYPDWYEPGKDYNVGGRSSFKSNVKRKAARLYGNWEHIIDKVNGQGTVDKILDELYEKGWGEGYAAEEIGFFYDLATGGIGSGTPQSLSAYGIDLGLPGRSIQRAYDYPGGLDKKDWEQNIFKGKESVPIDVWKAQGGDPDNVADNFIEPHVPIFRPFRQ